MFSLSIRLVTCAAVRRSLMSIAQPRTKQEQEHANKRVLEKQAGRRKKIKDAGIDYDFEGHVSAACCRSSSSWGFVVAFLEGMRADQISEVDGVMRSGREVGSGGRRA